MFLDDELCNVRYEQEPHNSHDMTEWEQTICCLPNNDRFGRRRYCKRCEGWDYLCGGAGSRWQDKFMAMECKEIS